MEVKGNVFKCTPLGASDPKNKMLPKSKVSHKTMNIKVFALDIAFKLG